MYFCKREPLRSVNSERSLPLSSANEFALVEISTPSTNIEMFLAERYELLRVAVVGPCRRPRAFPRRMMRLRRDRPLESEPKISWSQERTPLFISFPIAPAGDDAPPSRRGKIACSPFAD